MFADQGFIKNELVGALCEMSGGSAADPDHNHFFALLTNRIDQRDKIAVAGGKHELGDVGIGVQGLHCFDAKLHVDAILDRAARAAHIPVVIVGRHIHWLDAIGVQRTGHTWVAVPVGIGAGNHYAPKVLAALHDRFEVGVGIELVADTDIHVFEVDKDRNIRAM